MIYPKSRFQVAQGYRLHFAEQQGAHVLQHATGTVELSEMAYEVLAMVSENRSFAEIVETLAQREMGREGDVADSIRGVLEEAHALGWIQSTALMTP